ncbi:hypothetical protein COO60DRAFT_1681808 [Scenedesmus sp. NREL 46B-D3]|nr:hypothetical protein COO60DRAFT_1681808 [Scenedesmus sp. NREL 46B-D3]
MVAAAAAERHVREAETAAEADALRELLRGNPGVKKIYPVYMVELPGIIPPTGWEQQQQQLPPAAGVTSNSGKQQQQQQQHRRLRSTPGRTAVGSTPDAAVGAPFPRGFRDAGDAAAAGADSGAATRALHLGSCLQQQTLGEMDSQTSSDNLFSAWGSGSSSSDSSSWVVDEGDAGGGGRVTDSPSDGGKARTDAGDAAAGDARGERDAQDQKQAAPAAQTASSSSSGGASNAPPRAAAGGMRGYITGAQGTHRLQPSSGSSSRSSSRLARSSSSSSSRGRGRRGNFTGTSTAVGSDANARFPRAGGSRGAAGRGAAHRKALPLRQQQKPTAAAAVTRSRGVAGRGSAAAAVGRPGPHPVGQQPLNPAQQQQQQQRDVSSRSSAPRPRHDYTHPAFGSCTAINEPAGQCRVVAGKDLVGDEFVSGRDVQKPDDDPRDCHSSSHGTTVAGIAAAA